MNLIKVIFNKLKGQVAVDSGNVSGAVKYFGTIIQKNITYSKYPGKIINDTIAETDGILMASIQSVSGDGTQQGVRINVIASGNVSYGATAAGSYGSPTAIWTYATVPIPKGSTFSAKLSGDGSQMTVGVKFTWIPFGNAAQVINWGT